MANNKSKRSMLFAKFNNIDEKIFENAHGIGLEFYLGREIIQKHGGNIWYEAKENGSDLVLPCPMIY
jgi:signal transduction histidine kinase